MIIVSQDDNIIINFDNVLGIWINDNSSLNGNDDFEIIVQGTPIGNYKTKKRAKEVLQEIVTAYDSIEITVYEMPKV